MLRGVAQIVSLVTILAATSNAECAISCALIAMTPALSGTPVQATAHQEDHACCPHHRQSDTGTGPANPCPKINSQPSNARIESNHISIPALTPLAQLEPLPIRFLFQSLTSIALYRTGDPPGSSTPALIAVLRV